MPPFKVPESHQGGPRISQMREQRGSVPLVEVTVEAMTVGPWTVS